MLTTIELLMKLDSALYYIYRMQSTLTKKDSALYFQGILEWKKSKRLMKQKDRKGFRK